MDQVFYSLVGLPDDTSRLYTELCQRIPSEFPHLKPAFVGDPFEEFKGMLIGEKRKRSYGAEARVCMRWSLLFEFNAKRVNQAIRDGARILFAKRYALDLYLGAIAYKSSLSALTLHRDMIRHGMKELGINPPMYIFPKEPSAEFKIKIEEYFDSGHSPNSPVYMPQGLDVQGQAAFIISIVHDQLAARNMQAKAA